MHAELLARAVTALGVRGVGGRQVTPSAVRNLAVRGRLARRGTDIAGRPLYRVGDLLDIIERRRTTAAARLARMMSNVASSHV